MCNIYWLHRSNKQCKRGQCKKSSCTGANMQHIRIQLKNNYWNTGNLYKYYRDEPSLGNDTIDFGYNTTTYSFKSKTKITKQREANGSVETTVPLVYLGIFQIPLEMLLINCEINFILTLSANFHCKSCRYNNLCNNWHKNLCPSCSSINSWQ